MAQQLQNPFAQDYPETIDHTYETTAQRCRFNDVQGPWAGNLLATGGQDGVVEVWDMEMTNGALVRMFDGHVKAVESLSWSRNGRFLATSSKDWRLNIWDLGFTSDNMPDIRYQSQAGPSKPSTYPTSEVHYNLTLDSPLLNVVFHPRTSRILLVTTAVNEVIIVRLTAGAGSTHTDTVLRVNERDDDAGPDVLEEQRPRKRRKFVEGHEILYLQPWSRDEYWQQRTAVTAETCNDQYEVGASGSEERISESNQEEFTEAPSSRAECCSNLAFATFDRSGDRIYAGTRDGMLWIYDARTRWIIWRQKICTSLIKQIAFDRTGRYMVVNSSDRAVRVYVIIPGLVEADTGLQSIPITIHELHRFQDTIGKTPWNTVGFSGDGEYVMGGAGTKTSHHIYIWDRSTGVLIKVLEGPKDALDDCDWSPSRPMIASCTSAGEINIWQTTTNEAWSAFAPGFEELEENREYVEREDEFDLEDEDELTRRKQAEEDQQVDFVTPRLGFGVIDSTIDGTSYWETAWPDDDNDSRFWPQDDLQVLQEDQAEVADAAE